MRFLIFRLIMKIEELYRLFLDSSGVTTDSRVEGAGKIFFALRGETFDGHSFIPGALEGGCTMAVVDDPKYAITGKTLVVDNVLTALQELAHHHRKQFDIPVLGITGSNGKTTTKELISDVLNSRYTTLSTQGNLNNHIGVPLTLLGLRHGHDIAVIEMGANHAGEIDALCRIAMPTHGLITNIGSAHLEGFGSLEGVRKAKGELFSYLKLTGGTAFLNSDRPVLTEMAEQLGLQFVSYGSDKGVDVFGELADSDTGLRIRTLFGQGQEILINPGFTGSYNFENVMAAVCSGIYFGVSPAEIKAALENYTFDNNRSQILSTNQNKLLLDAYNANPDSMRAALLNFARVKAGFKSVILGDMLELGDYSENEHKKVVEILQGHNYNEVFLVGRIFYNTPCPENFLRFETVDELLVWLKNNRLKDRFILIKGSRGIKLEKCIEVL